MSIEEYRKDAWTILEAYEKSVEIKQNIITRERIIDAPCVLRSGRKMRSIF